MRDPKCLLNLLNVIRGYLQTKSLKFHRLFSQLSKSCDPHSIFSQSSDFSANKHQKKKWSYIRKFGSHMDASDALKLYKPQSPLEENIKS